MEREVEGALLLGDMGEGLPFRPGTFDGVIRYDTHISKVYYFDKSTCRIKLKKIVYSLPNYPSYSVSM